MAVSRTLVWLRNDLRLEDNPAVAAACENGAQVALLYILDERAGAASRWWLHLSLTALSRDIAARGGVLLLRRGDPVEIIPTLAGTLGVTAVHAARAYEPYWRGTDRALDAALRTRNIAFHRHLSTSLFAPERITTQSGTLYGVFTPFAKAAQAAGVPEGFVPAPVTINALPAPGDRLEDWRLLPEKPDWAGGMRAEWTPGEAGARARLEAFLAGPVSGYAAARDLPGRPGTSKLSPHVHFGEISQRLVWHRAALHHGPGAQTFLKELLWREFSLNLLWQHEALRRAPIRPEFAGFPWAPDKTMLRAWQRGQTGVPIVDAGMRELWQTGWMHNRVRMIAASYLVKHLLQPWQDGEAWFWDTLCEADEAANGASWQWVAGCGADAAPYFRVFNPVLQGRKFDTDGAYVRRFVPELGKLPDAVLHAPWEADADTLARAGVLLGRTYPRPLVDLATGRDRALAAYANVKKN
ncbi:deoxyribodipyrimidine photo-lyase [Acidocella sp.]|uniref:cryptochrome/photolyase family protein n=1 Tax=Acidocella sp. TaxID=50710 RepID=UPI002635DB4E|nr:deoxyribodipyrimidine photo-lyase [Acidocella sp.]